VKSFIFLFINNEKLSSAHPLKGFYLKITLNWREFKDGLESNKEESEITSCGVENIAYLSVCLSIYLSIIDLYLLSIERAAHT
jgi:hypothetical protein